MELFSRLKESSYQSSQQKNRVISETRSKLMNSRVLETLKACSSVDRASDSDSESQGFDSLHAYSY